MLDVSCLNKLDTVTKETTRFSNPQVLSSTLAALGTLQPLAFGLLNRLVPLVLVSNYYLGWFLQHTSIVRPHLRTNDNNCHINVAQLF